MEMATVLEPFWNWQRNAGRYICPYENSYLKYLYEFGFWIVLFMHVHDPHIQNIFGSYIGTSFALFHTNGCWDFMQSQWADV